MLTLSLKDHGFDPRSRQDFSGNLGGIFWNYLVCGDRGVTEIKTIRLRGLSSRGQDTPGWHSTWLVSDVLKSAGKTAQVTGRVNTWTVAVAKIILSPARQSRAAVGSPKKGCLWCARGQWKSPLCFQRPVGESGDLPTDFLSTNKLYCSFLSL